MIFSTFIYAPPTSIHGVNYLADILKVAATGNLRILICVNGVLKHVNTPDSYLRERCANIVDSVRSLA